jgi:hypothetical protein
VTSLNGSRNESSLGVGSAIAYQRSIRQGKIGVNVPLQLRFLHRCLALCVALQARYLPRREKLPYAGFGCLVPVANSCQKSFFSFHCLKLGSIPTPNRETVFYPLFMRFF